jgi:ribosome maturation factor RimP
MLRFGAECFAPVYLETDRRNFEFMKHEEYEQRTEELLLPIAKAHGYEIVDVEFVKEGGNRFLRVYLDKPDGITVDDCEIASRELSDKLDEKDFIEESYVLEVSSPGLGRPLKKEKDYIRNIGELVEIRTFQAIDKQKEFCGILKAYDAGTVTIEEEDGTQRVFQKSAIALIRQAVIW